MYKVAVLPGDGIGPEVMDVTLKILQAAIDKHANEKKFEFSQSLVGGAAIDATGVPLPDDTLELCRKSDAILFGSVGGPKWESLPPDLQPERGALLPLRKEFSLFANLRPALIYPELSAASPLKDHIIGNNGLDILIIRELTGGIYFGKPKGRDGKGVDEKAYDTMVYTRGEIERIARTAFIAAKKRKNKVTSIDKANVLTTSVFWREVVMDLHKKEFSDIELNHLYVDNASMQLVVNPSQFDVMLCPNMFGDILSDEASMITGSIGMLASASLSEASESGKSFGLYEPAGGSAPDIAGKNIANPSAQILSAALMMRFSFNENATALALENAIKKTLKDNIRTADISYGVDKNASTSEFGEAL